MKKKAVSGAGARKASSKPRKSTRAVSKRKSAKARGKSGRATRLSSSAAAPRPSQKQSTARGKAIRKRKLVRQASAASETKPEPQSRSTINPPASEAATSAVLRTSLPISRAQSGARTLQARTESARAVGDLRIPDILLEGDEPLQVVIPPLRNIGPPAPAVTGGQTPQSEDRELPDPYGTGALVLSARDPHWLYAHWDLSREAQRRYNRLSIDGHLVLRACLEKSPEHPVAEMRVHPESQHWFVHVQAAGKQHVATLGYYDLNREWVEITRSLAVATPVDAPSAEARVVFGAFGAASLPSTAQPSTPPQAMSAHPRPAIREEISQPEPMVDFFPAPALEVSKPAEEPRACASPSKAPAERRSPVVDRIEQRREESVAAAEPGSDSAMVARVPHYTSSTEVTPSEVRASFAPESPFHAASSTPSRLSVPPDVWTPREEQVLLELIYGPQVETTIGQGPLPRPVAPNFAVASEVFAQQEPSPKILPEVVYPQGAARGISSPTGLERPGLEKRGGDFWMNINAELTIYGATEPTAEVKLGGRQIRLRPDGSFSYRFALPDGHYELTVQAVSTSGDTRQAQLGFTRSTQTADDVSVHPQDPRLKPPVPEGI